MNVASIQLGADSEARPVPHLVRTRAPAARATAHACLRYAQRVLGMTLDEEQLRTNWALRGRCERGIERLMERALCARKGDDIEVWVARTRAMVVQYARVLTVLVAPTSRGFGKRFLRQSSANGPTVGRRESSGSHPRLTPIGATKAPTQDGQSAQGETRC